jgi:predicted enzyme related to lactoylglutathione lyase
MQDLTPGTLCWFELATFDQDGAKQFYETLFGWSSEDSPMGPGQLYTIFKRDGADVGAAYTMREDQRASGVPPHWTIYVAVDDAQAIADRAPALGGTVLMPPFDVSDFGRMAVLQDPTGATFAIWQAGRHAGKGFSGRADFTICWADLSTPDQERAANFYSDLFGWAMVGGADGTPARPGDYYHIANAGELIGGIGPGSQHPRDSPAYWLIYIAVPDCRAIETQAATLGAQIHASTFPIGAEGWVAILSDPQGAVFGVHQGS